MHYINTFHFLHMFLVNGSTCLLLDLLALTPMQYFLLIVYQINVVSLLICGCKSGQDINKININTLHDDLANSALLIQLKSTLCQLFNQYHETLSKLLDKHAPKQTKSVQVRPPPWMSNEIVVAKDRRRYLETIWKGTRSLLDRSLYTKQLQSLDVNSKV